MGNIDWLKEESLPDNPGIYMFLDPSGEVLYVGKAKNLKKRVSSYRREQASFRIANMLNEAVSLDYLIARNEVEALLLECNLIKEHRPRYNVLMRDDKSYPYIAVIYDTPYPRFAVVRRILPGVKTKLYGPYTAGSARRTLDFLRKIFPVCTCGTPLKGRGGKAPCLDYHLGLCPGPCIGVVSPEQYSRVVDQVTAFLDGKQSRVIKDVENGMKQAASKQEYEKAAALRDQLSSLRRMAETQKVISPRPLDVDAIACVVKEEIALAMIFEVREGRLIAGKILIFPAAEEDEVIRNVLLQHYLGGSAPPSEILVTHELSEKEVFEKLLSEKWDKKIEIKSPQRGEKMDILKMAQENARFAILRELKKESRSWERARRGIEEIQEILNMDKLPQRIEGYDFSLLGGMDRVGALVVFTGGKPAKALYRRFKLSPEGPPDDLVMLKETISRRFSRYRTEKRTDDDETFAVLPDLILVDGGPTQVGTAAKVLKKMGLEIPLVGLAKKEEIIHRTDKPPIDLPSNHAGLQMLQQIRDEAHRFSGEHQRILRRNRMLASIMEEVAGIGPARRKKILQEFSDWREILLLTPDDIANRLSITLALAQKLREKLERYERDIDKAGLKLRVGELRS